MNEEMSLTRTKPTLSSRTSGAGDGAVLDVLEPDQLVEAKRRPFGRSRLGTSTKILMWGLRGYVLLMVVVVIDRIVQGVSGG